MILHSGGKQTFWHGALLLTIAGVITKILSAAYRVPYQNIAGDIGFYIYQQVYPFLGIVLALSLYGFPVMISKMISENGENDQKETPILALSFLTISFFSVIVFLGLYGFAELIANLMGDIELKMPIRMASFTFLLLPVISVLRGFYQGKENMLPTAISQVMEQSMRVSTILIVAYYLTVIGSDAYQVGSGAVFGSVTGGFAAMAVLFMFRRKHLSSGNVLRVVKHFSSTTIKSFPYKKLIFGSLIICITGLTLVLFQLVDAFTLYSLLIQSGVEEQYAKTVKGIFDRGQPLIQLGVVLSTSLSLSLVPAVAKEHKAKDHSSLIANTKFAILVNLIISVGATSGLVAIMKYTNLMLFMDIKGTGVLQVLAFSILFLSISLTHAAILQGLGYIKYPAISVIVGVVLKWILNVMLIPKWGTYGAAFATIMALLLIASINSWILYKRFKLPRLLSLLTYTKILLAGGIMIFVIKGYEALFFMFVQDDESRMFGTIFALSSVIVGASVYFLTLLLMKVFQSTEFELLSSLINRRKRNL
ncbi:oligosaccharide flippase family protein [Bacillus salitolerans]|uniref:Oligosaccharide flippase family protein n=1 Tax=Bacillus salitolerans TaxID=1437434 RepID=A0ABW4LP91_9BACI